MYSQKSKDIPCSQGNVTVLTSRFGDRGQTYV